MACIGEIFKINTGIFRIRLVGGKEFLCRGKWLERNGVATGIALSGDQCSELLVFTNEYSMERSLKYIGFKRRTVAELVLHLGKLGLPDYAIEEAVGKMLEFGFLNDESYCEDYIIEMTGKNLSTFEIRMKALRKGLNESVVDDALCALETLEKEPLRALRLVRKKYGGNISNNDFSKIRQYLYRKGFSSEAIGDSMASLRDELIHNA